MVVRRIVFKRSIPWSAWLFNPHTIFRKIKVSEIATFQWKIFLLLCSYDRTHKNQSLFRQNWATIVLRPWWPFFSVSGGGGVLLPLCYLSMRYLIVPLYCWWVENDHLHCVHSICRSLLPSATTDKKEKKIFLIYKKIQMVAVAKSYTRAPFWISLYMRKILFSFLSVQLCQCPSPFTNSLSRTSTCLCLLLSPLTLSISISLSPSIAVWPLLAAVPYISHFLLHP